MKINSYFFPMIREFKDLEYGDCFVIADTPFMKIHECSDKEYPDNAVLLSDGIPCRIPEGDKVFVAKADVTIVLVSEPREVEQAVVE